MTLGTKYITINRLIEIDKSWVLIPLDVKPQTMIFPLAVNQTLVDQAGSLLGGLAYWIGGIFLVALFSAIFGLLIQAFTPERIRQPALYQLRRIVRYWNNEPLTLSLTNSFHLEESILKEKASTRIRSDINSFLNERGHETEITADKAQERFQIELETSHGNLFLEIGLDATPGGEGAGGIHGSTKGRMQVLEVTTVRGTAKMSQVDYRDYRRALETCNQYVNSIGYSLSYGGNKAQKGVYSISCEMDSEPALSNFLANLNINEIEAKSDQLQIEIDKKEILVRNVGDGEFAAVADTIKDLIVYYG